MSIALKRIIAEIETKRKQGWIPDPQGGSGECIVSNGAGLTFYQYGKTVVILFYHSPRDSDGFRIVKHTLSVDIVYNPIC